MESKQIFDLGDEIIAEIINLLKEQVEKLRSNGLQPQKLLDLQQGVVLIKGKYIKFSSVQHSILFDGYEIIFVENFIEFFKKVYDERSGLLTQFSLRTLMELGFPRAQILFSKKIIKKEKNAYKLIIMLTDYGSLAINYHEHLTTFEELFKKNAHLLTSKQKLLFTEFINSAKLKNIKDHRHYTKLTRKLVDSVQDNLFKKTTILPIFNPDNIEAIFSGFSHILHGNVLLMKNILQNKQPDQHFFRIYWFLLLSGINTVNYLSEHLEDVEIQKKTDALNEKFKRVSLLIKEFWEKI